MPVPVGNLWTVQYDVYGATEATSEVDIDTEEGRASLHASLDEALDSGTVSITVAKPS